jgi:hypothetical protein
MFLRHKSVAARHGKGQDDMFAAVCFFDIRVSPHAMAKVRMTCAVVVLTGRQMEQGIYGDMGALLSSRAKGKVGHDDLAREGMSDPFHEKTPCATQGAGMTRIDQVLHHAL